MKVWHDDNRYPPTDEWEWAKDNATAQNFLATGDVSFISIDMDLGAVEGKDFNYGAPIEGKSYRGEPHRAVNWLRNMNNDPGENGIDLAKWMVKNGYVPEKIVVHTWNGWGGAAIIDCFTEGGFTYAKREFWSPDEAFLRRVYA